MYWDRWPLNCKLRIGIFQTIYTPFKYLPFPFGEFFRFLILKLFLKRYGSGWIRDGCTISYPENISIGQRVFINEFVYLNGAGGIEIGNNVAVGARAAIISDEHEFIRKDVLIVEQPKRPEKIIIEDDVYLGYGAVILKGVRIKKGVVIGANAVVTRDIPEYAIAVGAPAKVVGYRK